MNTPKAAGRPRLFNHRGVDQPQGVRCVLGVHPTFGKELPHKSRHNHSLLLRNRLSNATSESSAKPACLARTTVSRREWPQPKCSNRTRRQSSADLSWRNPFKAPVMFANSRQLAGKNDRSNPQSSCAAFGFVMLRKLSNALPEVNKQVSAYAAKPEAWIRLSGSKPRSPAGVDSPLLLSNIMFFLSSVFFQAFIAASLFYRLFLHSTSPLLSTSGPSSFFPSRSS